MYFRSMLIALALTVSLFATASLSRAEDHAVILLYHHVSDDAPPSTSVSPETFADHMDFIEANNFVVLPLSDILQKLKHRQALPNKAVAITFDDAYQSVLENAAPLLKRKGWPYTLFVNPEAIDKGYSNYMSWWDLKKLARFGAEFGNHSYSHGHLVRRQAHESEAQWRLRIKADIEKAQSAIKKHLSVETSMFAYPYGEYDEALVDIVKDMGFFGIAQQSGPVGFDVDFQVVPRFPLASNYDDLTRLAVALNSRPFVVAMKSSGPVVQKPDSISRQQYLLELAPGQYNEKRINCFDSGGAKLDLSLDKARQNIRLTMNLPPWQGGRQKINCTAPSTLEHGVFYWFSNLWLIKNQDGSWYRE